MQIRALGASGLRVSRLGLGTMTWGQETPAEDAARQLEAFRTAGGTLVDTSASYGDGAAEEILGTLLASRADRADVVLATKAGISRRTGQRVVDASRRALLNALDTSLRRLGTDHVDLWQVHAWDADVPYPETLAALDTAVATGRTRYVGVSNYTGWQLGAAAATQLAGAGRAPLISHQLEYSLLRRGAETELLPAAAAHGLGALAWSPLASGVLTGKYRGAANGPTRRSIPRWTDRVDAYGDDRGARVVEAVVTAADGLGVAPARVALAWVLDRPGITAALLGARTEAQLAQNLAAERFALPPEIRAALDDASS